VNPVKAIKFNWSLGRDTISMSIFFKIKTLLNYNISSSTFPLHYKFE
jgi:hypothetical protein